MLITLITIACNKNNTEKETLETSTDKTTEQTNTALIEEVSKTGYVIGDEATDFKLKNIDEKFVSLADYPDKKGFIIVLSSNHCPYAVAY